MNERKLKAVKAAGFKVTTPADWLGLTKEEATIVEMRVALSRELERQRKANGITQAQLAAVLGTRQSGIARLERRPETASIETLIKGLVAIGVPLTKIAACLVLGVN